MRSNDIKYNCKTNNNHFIMEFEDGEIALFGVPLPNDGWIVNPIKGLEKIGYVFFKKK